ncbi:mannitol dehydrogenase family protein [Burkholderia sp. Ac-20353]|uniref:mannitol dehydrogenase family protein n=1 Tax=Burkholderia sp. Ac-20353 TaxID=2703894 RepID=UPI00197B7A35|nr:mannitol dehydrogenase family protein [Burkholderia sp. Ac-20353]MBN3785958.1 mannitol dehydrogenase family protein [Burkholderia sp. Ac-20353]
MNAHAQPRLSTTTLGKCQAYLSSRQWRTPGIGIVHLGPGNFHRAHQAPFTEDAMIQAGGDWGICGVLMRGDIARRHAFAAQNGLYSVIERSRDDTRVHIVRSITEMLAMPHDFDAVFSRLRHPGVRIVSLTITEKGYCLAAGGEGLDTLHPDIVHDLEHPDKPITAVGVLVAALAQRHTAPFTVMSCDNLQHNGEALRRAVLDFARLVQPELADWIAESVPFPSTMVDRITPVTTGSDLADAAEQLGVRDELAVSCEFFRQWVIEDRFPHGRPAWERAGAQFVESVTPYEQAKLRMLNGSHSAIAYLSMIAGFSTVDKAVADEPMHALIRAMMTDEIAPTLTVPASFDLHAYRDTLLERLANPALRHRCDQIAADGSKKLPQRLLAPLRERLAAGASIRRLALAVAAWMRHLRGESELGTPYPISDPMSDRLVRIARATGDNPAATVNRLLAVREIFPESLASHEHFVCEVQQAVAALQAGVRNAIRKYR